MAIAFISSNLSAANASATATPVTYPVAIAAGDGLVLVVGTKPFSGTITTPAGWTALGEITNGTTGSGIDTGSVKAAAFFREAVGTETGSLTVTITGGNSSWASILRFTKAVGAAWQTGFASGTDATANTAWLVGYTTNPGITSGDHLVMGGVVSTDLAVNWTAQTISGATGATISVPTALQNPRITTGQDSGGHVSRTTCTAGTATANPTWNATLSVGTNQSGSGVMVRLREVTPAFRVPAPYLVQRESIRRSSRRF